MRDTELSNQQADALYSAYKKGLEEGRFLSLRDAANYIKRQQAPCFFISSHRASILVGMIQSNVSLVNLSYNMRRMAWQLFRNYKAFKKENPELKLSRERIMEIVIDNPAPEFYLSGDAVRRILSKKIKMVRQSKGW